jgi:ubiquinone/menaquinone biosynthesis C-methylase UbiE
MQIDVAIRLIENGVDKTTTPQVWADLGSGSGLFTAALSTLVTEGSTLYALDTNEVAFNEMEPLVPGRKLMKIKRDFTKDLSDLGQLDGIIMANALHYVPDARTFLIRLKNSLKPSGRLIIVEYDRTSANPWIPYPISFNVLNNLAKHGGFNVARKLGETPSSLNDSKLYAALLQRHDS